jgi:hypothetical protein
MTGYGISSSTGRHYGHRRTGAWSSDGGREAVRAVYFVASLILYTAIPTVALGGLDVDSIMTVRRRVSPEGGPTVPSGTQPTVHNVVVARATSAEGAVGTTRSLQAEIQLADENGTPVTAKLTVTIADPRVVYSKQYKGRLFARSGAFSVSACEDRVSVTSPAFPTDPATLFTGPQSTGRSTATGMGRRLAAALQDPCEASGIEDHICEKMQVPPCVPGTGIGGEVTCTMPASVLGLEAAIDHVDTRAEGIFEKTKVLLHGVHETLGTIHGSLDAASMDLGKVVDMSQSTINLYKQDVQARRDSIRLVQNLTTESLAGFANIQTASAAAMAEQHARASAVAAAAAIRLGARAEDTNAAFGVLHGTLEQHERAAAAMSAGISDATTGLYVRLDTARTITRAVGDVYRDTVLRRGKARKLALANRLLQTHGLKAFESACDPPIEPGGELPENMNPARRNQDKTPFLDLSVAYGTSVVIGGDVMGDYDVVLGRRQGSEWYLSHLYKTALGIDIGPLSNFDMVDNTRVFLNFRRFSFFADNEFLLENRDSLTTAEDVLRMIGPAGCTPRVSCNVWVQVERARCMSSPSQLEHALTPPVDMHHGEEGQRAWGIQHLSEMGQHCLLFDRGDSSMWFSIDDPDAASLTGLAAHATLTDLAAVQDAVRGTCRAPLRQVETPGSAGCYNSRGQLFANRSAWFTAKSSAYTRVSGMTRSAPTQLLVQSVNDFGLFDKTDPGGEVAGRRCGLSAASMVTQSRAEAILHVNKAEGLSHTHRCRMGMTLPYWINSQVQVATHSLYRQTQVAWEMVRGGSIGRNVRMTDIPFFVANATDAEGGVRTSVWRASNLDAYHRDRTIPAPAGHTPEAPVPPPPIVRRCGVATTAVHGRDMLPIYTLTYLRTTQIATVSITIGTHTAYTRDIDVRRESSIASVLPVAAVTAGFLASAVGEDGTFETNPPPGRSPGEHTVYDTGPGDISASRTTDLRCRHADYMMVFEDMDPGRLSGENPPVLVPTGKGLVDADAWRRTREGAGSLGSTKPPFEVPYRPSTSYVNPAGIGGLGDVRFGADQWHAQERKQAFDATCAATSIASFRRKVVPDQRPRTRTAPDDAETTHVRGGLRCSTEDLQQAGAEPGFWCSVLETHMLVAPNDEEIFLTLEDLDDARTVHLLQKEWTADFSFHVPAGVLVVDADASRARAQVCPDASAFSIVTPGQARSYLSISNQGKAGALLVSTHGLAGGTGAGAGAGPDDPCASTAAVPPAASSEYEAMSGIPLPATCELLQIVVTASSGTGLPIECWRWKGNMTRMWERSSRREPYFGGLDAVSTAALAPRDGQSPSSFGGSGALPRTVSMSGLGDATRIQSESQSRSIAYLTVSALAAATHQATGLLRQRRALQTPPQEPSAARDRLAQDGMALVDTLGFLRRTLVGVNGVVTHNIDALNTSAAYTRRRTTEIVQMARRVHEQSLADDERIQTYLGLLDNQTKVLVEDQESLRSKIQNLQDMIRVMGKVSASDFASSQDLIAIGGIPADAYSPSVFGFQRHSGGPLGDLAKDILDTAEDVVLVVKAIVEEGLECAGHILDSAGSAGLMGLLAGVFGCGFMDGVLEALMVVGIVVASLMACYILYQVNSCHKGTRPVHVSFLSQPPTQSMADFAVPARVARGAIITEDNWRLGAHDGAVALRRAMSSAMRIAGVAERPKRIIGDSTSVAAPPAARKLPLSKYYRPMAGNLERGPRPLQKDKPRLERGTSIRREDKPRLERQKRLNWQEPTLSHDAPPFEHRAW